MQGLGELPKAKLEIWEKWKKLQKGWAEKKKIEKYFVSDVSDFYIIFPIWWKQATISK